ncbi:TatD family hydrolase [Azospirillum baldaniorum]|uniref:TatD family hydrolase n=1 Tax=Azospirillum baldaniorum TaxID=1064539 RepID=UPI00157A3CC0|nr:TatD family hydrolase [Azospirillum baldaniorum]
MPLFDALLRETRYVGEVGLNGSPECKPHWRELISAFDHILAASARAGGHVLALQSRRTTAEILGALAWQPGAGTPVLHRFFGTKAELQRAIGMSCWLSVGPAMVTGKRGRDQLTAMPRGRVLTETEGPFAAIGGKPLGRGEVALAYNALAACWGVASDEAATAVVAAFRRLRFVGGRRSGFADVRT